VKCEKLHLYRNKSLTSDRVVFRIVSVLVC